MATGGPFTFTVAAERTCDASGYVCWWDEALCEEVCEWRTSPAPAGTTCRPRANACDVAAEACDGASFVCPADVFVATPACAPPGPFQLVSPPNDSVVTATPLLDWTDAPSAVNYSLWVQDSNTSVVRFTGTSAVSHLQLPPGVITEDVPFKWSVRAHSASGTYVDSGVWVFSARKPRVSYCYDKLGNRTRVIKAGAAEGTGTTCP
jgi:hypothetical protein